MPIDLRQVIDCKRTAVITVECQNAVIGPLGPLPALVAAVRASGMIENAAAVLAAARAAHVPVLHGTVVRRPDGGGVAMNCRLFTAAGKSNAPPKYPGGEAAALISEFGPAESDYLVPRLHGVSVFHDTEMDSLLRSLDIRTVILLGVSLNIALIGTTIEAVNRGYQVVLPKDGVVGTPPEYAAAVLENTMKLLATITTSAAVIECLRDGAAGAA